MPKTNSPMQLLVEGINDYHVIRNLYRQYTCVESFSIEKPDVADGVEALLRSIPIRLKTRELNVLGIVLDADQNLQGRWDAVCMRLKEAGYPDSEIPSHPDSQGVVISSDSLPRVGVWLMPDNQLPGMLENFVTHLIPDGDLLAPKAETILQQIEGEGLRQYSPLHHQKAFIHTWLAWQQTPGQPMGQAITAHVLDHNQPLADTFVAWLNRLFNLSV